MLKISVHIIALCLLLYAELIPAQAHNIRASNAVRVKTEASPEYVRLLDKLSKTKTKKDSFDLLIQLGQLALDEDLNSKRPSFDHYLLAYRLANHIDDPEAIVQATIRVAHIYKRTDQYDSCYIYCVKATELAKNNFDLNPEWLALAYREFSAYHYKKVNYQESLSFGLKSREIAERYGYHQLLVDMDSDVAYTHYLLGSHEKAMLYYLEAIQISELHKIERFGLHLGVATVLLANGDYDKAIDQIRIELSKTKISNNEYGEAEALWKLGQAHMKKEEYEIALGYALQSLKVNDLRYKKNYGYANLIASKSSMNLGDLTGALKYARDAYKMAMSDREPNQVLLSNIENQFGRVYYLHGNFEVSISHYKTSLKITDEGGYLEMSRDTRLQLSKLYEASGNMTKALTEYKKYMSLNDTLFTETKSRQLSEMKVKYESDKKDLQFSNLQTTNQIIEGRNRQYLIGGMLLLLMLLSLGIITFQLRRTKAKLSVKNKTIVQQNDALSEMDRLKTNLFSNITHEFRTPLTLILEPVKQLMKSNIDIGIKQKLKFVENNSEKLLGLVNELLDMMKLEGGNMQVDLRKGDILDVIRPVYQSFLVIAEKKGVVLKMKVEDSFQGFYFDRIKVEKVVRNLLSNALKFTNEGSVEVVIKKEALLHEDMTYVLLSVKDTGIGIPDNQLSNIFNRFYQVDSSSTRRRGGTGIGLALTKELIDLMGGEISVISRLGQGTTFEVRLPLSKIPDQASNLVKGERSEYIPTNEVASSDPQHNKSAKTVSRNNKELAAIVNGKYEDEKLPILLLVEDNSELRLFIKQTLSQGDSFGGKNFKVIEAWNGQVGMDKAISFIPDLIISDVMMPEMDGIEMTDQLKHHELTSHIPIILLTAKSGVDNRMKGLRIGADAYLTKPFHTEELLVRIEKLIELRKKLQLKYSNGSAQVADYNDGHSRLDRQFLQRLSKEVDIEMSNSGLSVELLAQKMFLSRSQLFRKVRALTGDSPSEFVRNYRLDQAKIILNDPKVTVHEVSEAVGFGDEKYFSNKFKERFGMSPSEV